MNIIDDDVSPNAQEISRFCMYVLWNQETIWGGFFFLREISAQGNIQHSGSNAHFYQCRLTLISV